MNDYLLLMLASKQRRLLVRLMENCAEGLDARSLLTFRRAVGTLFEMEAVMVEALEECGLPGAEEIRLKLNGLVTESRSYAQDPESLLAWTLAKALPFCAAAIGECDRLIGEARPQTC